MGLIYRRKNSKNYWIKYYKDGKPFFESTKSDKLEVAERILNRREEEIEQGRHPGIIFKKIKIDDLLEDLVLDYKINKKRTVARVERMVEYLKDEFDGMRVSAIDTTRIKKLIEKRLNEGYSNASINRELAALKRAFHLAARCTPPKVAQVPYIPMLKENNVRKGFVEHEDFLALREALPPYWRPLLTFGYFSGWRRGEISSLKWNQVNLREGIVRLEPGTTKNNEGRTLYLEPELWEMIRDLHRNRRLGCQQVFHLNGKKINDCRKSWKQACLKIGRPELLFHDLRRSGIRNMIRAGIPERVAMTISGHKTRSVFDRYNIVSDEDLREAARRRHTFTETQNRRLHFGDSDLFEGRKVINLNPVTDRF